MTVPFKYTIAIIKRDSVNLLSAQSFQSTARSPPFATSDLIETIRFVQFVYNVRVLAIYQEN